MAIIISIVLGFSLLAGTGAYVILNTNASTTTTTSLSNLYNTNGNINPAAVEAFLDAVGYWDNPSDTGTYTAHNIASRGTSGSDSTIIFPMGYYVDASGNMDTSKPILWQATYLRNGYLTIWMYKNYVVEFYNNSGTENTGFGNGTSYSTYSNYSKSTLRDVTNNIYAKLNGKLESFSSIIQSPKMQMQLGKRHNQRTYILLQVVITTTTMDCIVMVERIQVWHGIHQIHHIMIIFGYQVV